MQTFLEIFFTSVITFIAGCLAIKYRPAGKRRYKYGEPLRPRPYKRMAAVYHHYSAKFIFVLLAGVLLCTGLLVLFGNGYIVLKW